ncbi:MAG: trigger factor [Bacteroidota bacterium]
MNISLQHKENLTADLTFTLEPADYKDKVTAKIKEYGKQITLPGFRKGKIPLGVLKKMVGTSIMIEEINQMVSQNLYDYINEEELDVLGDPVPQSQMKEEDFDLSFQSDLTFVFEVGLAPEFEATTEFADLPPRYQVKVDDAFLEKEIGIYQDRFGESSTPEDVAKGDIVFGQATFEEEGAEAEPVEEATEGEEGAEEDEGKGIYVPLNPNRLENEAIFASLEGKNVGDKVEVDYKLIATEPQALADLLFIDVEQATELLEKPSKYEIKRVNRVVKAEVNEELYGKVAESLKWEVGEEPLTKEDFKTRLSESVLGNLEKNARVYFHNKLTDRVIDAHDLELPDTFLKNWLVKTNENKTEEDIENEYPDFKRSLTWTLVEGKLIKKYDVKVNDDEIDDRLKQNLLGNLTMQMGSEPDEALLKSYMEYMKQDQNSMQGIFRQVLSEKVLTALEEEIGPEVTEMDATDFMNLVEAERKNN